MPVGPFYGIVKQEDFDRNIGLEVNKGVRTRDADLEFICLLSVINIFVESVRETMEVEVDGH